MSRWRLAARLARRDVRRRPGRTALVALLVALPVAGMLVAAVLFETEARATADSWPHEYGTADAVVYPQGPTGTDLVASGLPDGSRLVELASTFTVVRTADGRRADLSVRERPPDDPLTDGIVDLVAGRLPAADDEVALSHPAADALGVEVGDPLALERPQLELDVVGLVEDADDLRARLAVVVDPTVLAIGPGGGDVSSIGLVDLPPDADWAAIAAVMPIEPREHAYAGDDATDERVSWSFVIGGLVLTVAGVVIAAAFASGARRQLTTLGQLSANGAPGSVLQAMLVLQGTVTGVVGGLAGLALAAAVLAAGRGPIEAAVNRRLPGFEVRPAQVAIALLFGVVAATVAAVVPARTVTRVPTLTALAGRRPLPPVRRSVVLAGFAAVAAGMVLFGAAVLGGATGRDGAFWSLVAIAGGVLELLGTCAIAPAAVSYLEPLGGRTRGAWRLAARGLARQRSRTGAVVSAVAAAAGLAVAAGALLAAADADRPDVIEVPDDVAVASVVATGSVPAGDVPGPPDDATARELDAILPGASTTPVRLAGAQSDWPDLRLPVVADEALLDAIGAPEQVRDLLDEVGLVEFGPAEELGGVQITPVDSDIAPEPGSGVTDRQATLPNGTMQPIGHGGEGFMVGGGPWNLVDPELVDDLGVDPVMGAVVYRTPDPLTDRQLDDLDALRSDWYLMQPPGTGGHLDISARWNETDGPTPVQVELVLAGVALVLSVLVVGASLALAAAESRDERDVLTVVGASPGALARASGIRALLLSATGAAMAVPAGLLPVAVAVAADHGSLRFVVPWRTIGLLVVALPLVAGVVALVVGSAGQRLRPVRLSTARFE